MKVKDIVSITKNKNNKQLIASFKKKKMKELDIDVNDILNLKVKKWQH